MRDSHLDRLIDLALDEDLGAAGDVTTSALVAPDAPGTAELWAKQKLTLSGSRAFVRVFERVDPRVEVEFLKPDGAPTQKRELIARLKGPLASLLVGERTALNIIQRTSGMATASAQVAAVLKKAKGTKLKVLDTRKTSPGLRALSKQAVLDGGLTNHRFGLFDGVLIKDNHIAAVGGSISEALKRARAHAPRLVKIEIEVTTLEQLTEAIDHGAHIVMLDNMNNAMVKRAVKLAAGRVELEVSGGVTIERIAALAQLGVDYVSMGALTHSAPSVDLSLEIAVSDARRS